MTLQNDGSGLSMHRKKAGVDDHDHDNVRVFEVRDRCERLRCCLIKVKVKIWPPTVALLV